MPNENKEWEEDFDKKWFHFADKSVSTTLNQHRWSMKDVVRGYIAEATRRGKVEGLEEAMTETALWALAEEQESSICEGKVIEKLLAQHTTEALRKLQKAINSRIQQYGKQ